MGLFDLLRPRSKAVEDTRSALEEAREGDLDDGTVTTLIQGLLGLGLDGKGPVSSAKDVAAQALAKHTDETAAIEWVIKQHTLTGAAGGFVTGLGGFIMLPVALPVNVVEFYVQATRMVGAIATIRGYDVQDAQIRSAVLLTLIGSDADNVLKRVGLMHGTGRVATMATGALGPAARLMINKAVGFQLLKNVGEKSLASLGKGIPLAGGVIGASFDGYTMHQIGKAAEREFPRQQPSAPSAT